MQGRIAALYMRKDRIAKNFYCDIADDSFSFPMREMKRMASQIETRSVEIHIPDTVERLDRVHMTQNRSRKILKSTP